MNRLTPEVLRVEFAGLPSSDHQQHQDTPPASQTEEEAQGSDFNLRCLCCVLTSEPASGLSGPGGDDGHPVLNLSDVTAGGKAINQTEEEDWSKTKPSYEESTCFLPEPAALKPLQRQQDELQLPTDGSTTSSPSAADWWLAECPSGQ